MDAVIISTGTELVIGQCVDTNAAWLARSLTHCGINVVRHITVGDDASRLTEAIRSALSQGALVGISGGLGPTPDDLTRQAVADVLGTPLKENAAALAGLRRFFERLQRPMPDLNRVQALVPEGCDIIPNPRGTAPGILYREGDKLLFALPGVPAEMHAMFDASVRPLLKVNEKGISEISLSCFGISEARLAEALADLMQRDRNPTVGTTASDAVLTVRIVARGRDQSEADRLARADATEVKRRLAHVVFGEGNTTLAEAVGTCLKKAGRTVAVAESCTGGLLGAYLTDTPGSSAYFLCGYVTYSNEAKTRMLGVDSRILDEHGAVSEPAARAMACGCREAAGSDFALSITGIAGPTGGTQQKPVGLVYIGLADADGVEVHRFLYGEHLTRREIRDRACKTALNLLRLRLLSESS